MRLVFDKQEDSRMAVTEVSSSNSKGNDRIHMQRGKRYSDLFEVSLAKPQSRLPVKFR